ncbi:MAG: hypothetical protein GYA35_03840 [Thermoanaerobaculaceae bacterium]|nr:hypothetical protein [Thermoanaerobaculaceae bacterium]
MKLKINWFYACLGIGLIWLLIMISCKRVGSKIILQDRDVQWERCSYLDGSGYLAVKKNSSFKKIKFYKYKRGGAAILDMMIGKKNELILVNFNNIESFSFIDDKNVQRTKIYDFPKGWFIDKLIGRIGDSIWVYGDYSNDTEGKNLKKKAQNFIALVQNGKMEKAIPLKEVIREPMEDSNQGCPFSDICGDIPCMMAVIGKSEKIPEPKFYLCYFDPCKDKWYSLKVPPFFLSNVFPMVKVGNKLISLVDKDVEIVLDCEKQNSFEPIYSKRNYFWPIGDDKYVYLYHYREGDGTNKNTKAKTKLMLYNTKTKERKELREIPLGYYFVGFESGKNSLVLRAYDQSLEKDLIIDLKALLKQF